MDIQKVKKDMRARRHGRVRAKVSGTAECPRLSVFRSNKGMFLQLIDDKAGKTLVSAYSKEVKSGSSAEDMGNKEAASYELGKILAEKAKKANIKKVVFDRGGYNYHGRVKAAADGAREGGLKF